MLTDWFFALFKHDAPDDVLAPTPVPEDHYWGLELIMADLLIKADKAVADDPDNPHLLTTRNYISDAYVALRRAEGHWRRRSA